MTLRRRNSLEPKVQMAAQERQVHKKADGFLAWAFTLEETAGIPILKPLLRARRKGVRMSTQNQFETKIAVEKTVI